MSCKITRITPTKEEFVKLKAFSPFSIFRQSGKSCNFSLIFGASAKVFSDLALDLSWTEAQIDEYIKTNKLDEQLDTTRKFYKSLSMKKVKYVTAAANMRKGFFDLYKGLMNRIKRNQELAKAVGFIIGPFGNARKLIELMLAGEYDLKEKGSLIRNSNNKAANTDIQQFEAGIMHMAVVQVGEWLEENNMKSKIWNTVHDSIDGYVYKPELKAVVMKLREEMTRAWPQLKGVPLAVDMAVSDLKAGDYYKHGSDPSKYIGEWDC